ncbi:MAG: hypothetical protein ABIO81_14010, partial [Ginsengibacter sp.]
MNIKDTISSGLLELYALGLASPEQTDEVETIIAQHHEVKLELEEIQKSLETYAQAHAVEPPASVREKIFSRVTSQVVENNLSNN